MGRETEYVYGDSTPASLKTDFVSLLRASVDFAIEVLLHDDAVANAAAQSARAIARLEKDTERATDLGAALSSTLQRARVDGDDELMARCTSTIGRAVDDMISAEGDHARAAISAEKARVAQAVTTARARCVAALDAFLSSWHLPEATTATVLRADGAGYDATLQGRTPYGLRWTQQLDIPWSHALVRLVRLDSLVKPLEVRAPKSVGWFRREVRVRPQRIDRLWLVELATEAASTVMKLRSTPTFASRGFDVTFFADPARVELLRVLPGGLTPDEPHVAEGDDIQKLEALRGPLMNMLADLTDQRRSLLDASLDDVPLEKLDAPRLLVARLLGQLAPTANEIAKRSLVPGEIVIKRVLGDNHREEVFVSKAALREKLRVLPQSLWPVFDPLHLWDDEAPRASPSRAPESRTAAPAAEDAPMSKDSPDNEPPPPGLPVAKSGRPQPPGAGNHRPAPTAECTGRWPALKQAFQKS